MPFQPGNKLGGRKKARKTLEAEKLREFVIDKIRERAEDLVEAKMALALGHYKAVTNSKGEVVDAYLVEPDGNAIPYFPYQQHH